jgi:type IV pilus assembly protein PilM
MRVPLPHFSIKNFNKQLLSAFPAPAFMSPLAAAIDISESSVKYLSLIRKGALYVPDTFLQVALPEGVIKAGEIVKPEQLAQTLKGISVRVGGGEVYLSLPEEFAYLYPITISGNQNTEQMKTAVEFSLSEHVPLPAQQIVYDSTLIPNGSEKGRALSVTAYDAKKSEAYIAAATSAGFFVRAVETEVHAAARACVPLGDVGTTLVFDIGRTRTGITAVLNGIPVSTSTIAEGGKCTTEALLGITGNDIQKAEQLKIEHGLALADMHSEVREPLEACLSTWMAHIRDYIQFLNQAGAGAEVVTPQVSKVFLCGGESAVPGFSAYVSKELGMTVEVGDVWSKLFSYNEYIPSISKPTSLRLATAVGLVLRNFEE